MTVRFRIRTQGGQELSFTSHEIFSEFVRSGDLAPEDLVYDGETHEWAPARTHPLVLEIQYEEEDRAEAEAAAAAAEDAPPPADPLTADNMGLDLAEALPPSEGDAPKADAWGDETASPSDEAGDLGLELAPPAAGLTPEQEAEAFVAKMQAERAIEREFGGEPSSMQGFRMEESGFLAEPTGAPVPQREEEPRPKAPPPKPRIAQAAPRPKKGGAGVKIALGVLAVAGLGAGAYFGMGLLEEPVVDDPFDPLDTVTVTVDAEPPPGPPPPQPVIATTVEAVRERALERFLTSTQNALRELEPVPDGWLEGEYFSLTSDYPEVSDVWTRYLTVIRQVRAEDLNRYARAYDQALDDAAIQGEARAARREAGLAAFVAASTDLEAHWDRVEAVAVAALQSHDALLGAEGLIMFDASGVSGRASGLGVGTSGRDADSQLLLDQVIELMEGVLVADGLGPNDGPNVREWVQTGFLDAVAN